MCIFGYFWPPSKPPILRGMWTAFFHLFLDDTVEVFNYRVNSKWIQQMKHIGRYEWNHSVLRANCSEWAECARLSSLQRARETWYELRRAKEQSVTNQPGCHCWSNLPGVSPVCWNKVSVFTHCQISSMWHFQKIHKKNAFGISPISPDNMWQQIHFQTREICFY